MPIVTPIIVLNAALLLAFATVIVLIADRVYEIAKGERLFISADSAPQALRVSIFLMTALVLIVMGFFSWENFVISARERNLLQAEQELRDSQVRLSNEIQVVAKLPLEIEALNRSIQAKRMEFAASEEVKESELEAASASVTAASIERGHLTSDDVASSEATRDKELSSVEIDVVSEFETRRLDLDANIASLRSEMAQLTQENVEQEQLQMIDATLQAAETKRQSLFQEVVDDRAVQINAAFRNTQQEYRLGQDWADAELSRKQNEIEARADIRRTEIQAKLSSLENTLDIQTNRFANSETVVSQMESEVASLAGSVERVLANIDIKPLRQSSADTALAFRALALGALGAMVTLLISHERAQTGRLRSIFSDKDFFTLFISQMVRGSVVAVSGYAIVFTDILSFNDSSVASADAIPDFWKMTLVCIALGAFAERIYDTVGTRLSKDSGQETT